MPGRDDRDASFDATLITSAEVLDCFVFSPINLQPVQKRLMRSHKKPPRHGHDVSETLLLGSAIAFVAVCVVTGGRAFLTPLGIAPLGVAGSVLLGIVCYTGAWRNFLALPLLARFVLAGIVLLPAAQLIPLPPDIWRSLPGRELVAAALDQAGAGNAWQPLTLMRAATIQTLLQALWLVALLCAVLSLSPRSMLRLFDAILILVALHIALGVVQVASKGSLANFLSSSDGRYLIGVFANKNHSALFLCFGAVVALLRWQPARVFDRSRRPILIPAVAFLIVLVVATTSRAGIALMVATLAASLLFVPKGALRPGWPTLVTAGGLTVLAGIAASLRSTRTVFAHFGNTGSDLRFRFWEWSAPLAREFMVFGSGFGSFPGVFATREALAWVKPTFVNHVHNEYIEMIIEGGVAALVLLAMFAALVIRLAIAAWRIRSSRAGWEAVLATLIILLCAAHSMVDYPLRRMGIAVVFFIALALLLRVGTTAVVPDGTGEAAVRDAGRHRA